MKTLVAILLAAAAASPSISTAQPIDYRFEAVKRTVTVLEGQNQKPATLGLLAHSGDRVQTGWFSSAMLNAEKYKARFEIFSATDVTLTAGTPGVLLTVERGRIRAAFDKILGNEPRIVKTPGALLAVRGTQFDVEVDQAGKTIVSVFEGIVEVQSPLRREPLFVRPGEQSEFGREMPPRSGPMSDERRRRAPDGTIDRQPPDHRGNPNVPERGTPPMDRPDGPHRGGMPGTTTMPPSGPGGQQPGGPGGQRPPA